MILFLQIIAAALLALGSGLIALAFLQMDQELQAEEEEK